MAYMRTFWSHDETARWSDLGEKASSDTLSEGGCFSSTSFPRSPWVLFADAAAEPKSVVMVGPAFWMEWCTVTGGGVVGAYFIVECVSGGV
jgi:hypothetical protein